MVKHLQWDEFFANCSQVLLNMASAKDMHLNLGFKNKIRYNHAKDLTSKLDWLIQYCVTNKCFFVTTGDLSDVHDGKKWPFNCYVENKRQLEKFRTNGVAFYSIEGNHDYSNGIKKHKNTNTVFQEFVREGVVQDLTENPIGFKTSSGKIIKLMGVDYEYDLANVEHYLETINSQEKTDDDLFLVVLHAHVTPTNLGSTTDFAYDDLIEKYPNIDGYICGHYHGGFPTESRKSSTGKKHLFVNNWNFQRMVRDHYNLDNTHTPEIEHIVIGEDKDGNLILTSKTVQIPCGSFDDTFKPKVVEILKQSKADIFEFFDKVNFDDLPIGMDNDKAIEAIGQKNKFTPTAMQMAIQYLNDVED